MFSNNMDSNIRSNIRSMDSNMTAIYMWIFFYFTIFKDYVTGLEVLARLLQLLFVPNFQGRVIVSSHSTFIHSFISYIEVELVLSTFKRTLFFQSLLSEFHFI